MNGHDDPAGDITRLVERRTRELEAARADLKLFKSSFFHEVQSPLRAVDGCIAAALEDFGDQIGPDARSCLDRALTTVHTMSGKVEALLDFFRYSNLPMARSGLDLTATAQGVFDEMTSTQPHRAGLTVAPGLRVDADAVLLRVVLQNLIGNALKFSHQRDCARIEIGGAEVGGARRTFVRDNGAGFDARYANKLFQPFGRLHSPREFTGTGMSLAIVRRIVERHGGQVGAESEAGAGATFWFTLP